MDAVATVLVPRSTLVRVGSWTRAALAVLGAAVVAAPGTARAYRTFADDPEVAYPARFEADVVEWEIWTSASVPPERVAEIERLTHRALGRWAGLPCTGVRTRFVGSSAQPGRAADGRNTLTFLSSGWTERGLPAGRPATTDVQLIGGSVWAIREADVYVDLGREWAELQGSGPRLEAVLAHELGHFFGLLHVCEHEDAHAPSCGNDSTLRESLLHPDYGALVPAADDAAGMCHLYPASTVDCGGACGPGTFCMEGRCVPECEGECAASCSDSADCAGGACAIGADVIGSCTALGARGAPCATSADCATRRCLTRTVAGDYCTIACGHDAQCARDEVCRPVGGMRVCAPPPPAAGCLVTRASTRARPGALSIIAAAVLCAARRRRSFR